MEGIFRGVCENRNLLEEAMGKYYNSATEPASFQVVQANFTKCGTCEGSMSLWYVFFINAIYFKHYA